MHNSSQFLKRDLLEFCSDLLSITVPKNLSGADSGLAWSSHRPWALAWVVTSQWEILRGVSPQAGFPSQMNI